MTHLGFGPFWCTSNRESCATQRHVGCLPRPLPTYRCGGAARSLAVRQARGRDDITLRTGLLFVCPTAFGRGVHRKCDAPLYKCVEV